MFPRHEPHLISRPLLPRLLITGKRTPFLLAAAAAAVSDVAAVAAAAEAVSDAAAAAEVMSLLLLGLGSLVLSGLFSFFFIRW